MKRSKILIAIFFLLTFGFIGMVAGFAGGSLFIPKGSGLAGPAVALGYGLIGFIVTMIIGGILVKILSYEKLRVALYFSAALAFIALAILIFRVIALRQSNEENIPEPKRKVTKPVLGSLFVNVTMESFYTSKLHQGSNTEIKGPPLKINKPLGVGIVKPELTPGKTLYFYNEIDFNKIDLPAEPVDSVTFIMGDHFTEIKNAPPWFYPEIMKLDYNLLLLRAITLSKNLIEVVVNKETGQKSFVDRSAVSFIDWNSFLLDVVCVEIIDIVSNPVRVKPLDHAGLVIGEDYKLLRPIAVRGSWLRVRINESAKYGWIRWRQNDKLLIRYYLLS